MSVGQKHDRPSKRSRRELVAELGVLTSSGIDDRGTNLRLIQLRAEIAASGRGSVPVGACLPSVSLYASEAPAPTEGVRRTELPEWIEVIPAPLDTADEGHVETRDWRPGFMLSNPQALVDAFNSKPIAWRPSIVDWEHRTHRGWGAERNPAAAWINELRVAADGKSVEGKVEWTPEGADDVRLRRYRYISPVVSLLWPADSEGRIDWDAVPEAIELIDAALTNNPATYIRDLAQSPPDDDSDETEDMSASLRLASNFASARATTKEPNMPAQLSIEALSALGLAENATQADVDARIAALTSREASPDPTPTRQEQPSETALLASFESLLKKQAENFAAQIDELKSEASKASAVAKKAAVDATLSEFSDRFTPAERDVLLQLGTDQGADSLRALLSVRPSLASLMRPVGEGRTGDDQRTVALSSTEAKVIAQLGITPDSYQSTKNVMNVVADDENAA